jgi:hypothetical protein
VVEVEAGNALRATTRGVPTLAERADQIQNVLDPIAQNHRTVAVLETADGGRIVGGGTRDLTPAQRATVGPGEQTARLPGAHAEKTVLTAAQGSGAVPSALATSRDICTECIKYIQSMGGVMTSSRTAVFPW